MRYARRDYTTKQINLSTGANGITASKKEKKSIGK